MAKVHNGVLIPVELEQARAVELDAYAEQVKAGNRAFCDAYFALEAGARRAGLTMQDLEEAR